MLLQPQAVQQVGHVRIGFTSLQQVSHKYETDRPTPQRRQEVTPQGLKGDVYRDEPHHCDTFQEAFDSFDSYCNGHEIGADRDQSEETNITPV